MDIIVLSDSDSSFEIVANSADSAKAVTSVSSNSDASIRSQNKKFKCPRCQRTFSGTDGIISKSCKHFVCKECIIDYYFKNQNFGMMCQFKADSRTDFCGNNLSEIEIRSALSEVGMNKLDETIIPNSQQDEMQTSSRASILSNQTDFCCGICCLECPIGQGIELSQCSHHVCKPCLRETIKINIDPEIRCPYAKSYERCAYFLTDSEIKGLVTKDEYEKFKQIGIKKATEPSELFLLTMMDQLSYIRNVHAFDCPICFVPCDALAGIRLRDCFHEFCLECFTSTVSHSEDESVKCPFTDGNLSHCENFIQEREIRAVVSAEIYNKFLERKLKFAEHSIANTFHCKTVDCPGFGIIETEVDQMFCEICKETNCLQCKAIHKNQTCEDYQDSLTGGFKMTERYIDNLKNTGDAMNCPKCQALINKIDGCSWLQCTFCKTEICWATKGPRWGAGGKGDTSGGCKCLLNGKRCDPTCNNCH